MQKLREPAKTQCCGHTLDRMDRAKQGIPRLHRGRGAFPLEQLRRTLLQVLAGFRDEKRNVFVGIHEGSAKQSLDGLEHAGRLEGFDDEILGTGLDGLDDECLLAHGTAH